MMHGWGKGYLSESELLLLMTSVCGFYLPEALDFLKSSFEDKQLAYNTEAAHSFLHTCQLDTPNRILHAVASVFDPSGTSNFKSCSEIKSFFPPFSPIPHQLQQAIDQNKGIDFALLKTTFLPNNTTEHTFDFRK